MYEEKKNFSWTSLFLKIILVVIFIIFTAWLISLSTKNVTKKVDVLADETFANNLEKMKSVGREYFTTERLPEKVGVVKKITLAKMYDENLLLELKDKDGNVCSAANSYVSVEKLENEYRMKINLECGDEKQYIISIMGCYDYCDTDICEVDNTIKEEKKEEKKENVSNSKGNTTTKPTPTTPTTPTQEEPVKTVEYEYVKTTSGYWTDYSNWSNWSVTSIAKTDSRDVATKVVIEDYTYDKPVTKTVYSQDATCPSVTGYTNTSRNNNVCNYSKTSTSYASALCPSVSGYTYTGYSGTTCYYSATTKVAVGKKRVTDCSGCAARWQTVYETKTTSTTRSTYCPNGYSKSGSSCVATSTSTTTRTATCPTGQSLVSGKCYKTVNTTEKAVGSKNVTYYRYRVRSYVEGSTTYKWSKTNSDSSLINAGYKLTGKTR